MKAITSNRQSKTEATIASSIARYAAQLSARKAAGEGGEEFDAVLTSALEATRVATDRSMAYQLEAGMLLLTSEGAVLSGFERESRSPRESVYALDFDRTNGARSWAKHRTSVAKANEAREDAALVRAAIIAVVSQTVEEELAAEVADSACSARARVARYGSKCRTHAR